MNYYDATENSERLHRMMLAMIGRKAVDIASGNANLVVVFDGDPSPLELGRITLFQRYIDDRIGIVPEILKQVPACIKVFFRLPIDDRSRVDQVKVLLRSEDAQALYRDLRISQLQYAGEMLFPK